MQSRFRDLESRPFFRLALLRRSLWLALALALNLAVVALVAVLRVEPLAPGDDPPAGSQPLLGYSVHFAFHRPEAYFWLIALLVAQVVLANWAFRQVLKAEGMTSLFPDDRTAGRTYGGLTGPQLVKMVQELADEMGVKQVRQIVVSDRPDPNAYTAHVLGLGNVVVLHVNLLQILPPAGVRAIVAHEVAHARRRDSLTYVVLGFPRSFVALMGAFVLWKIGVGIVWWEGWWVLAQRLLFLGIVWSAATWVLTRLRHIANAASRQSEHVADAYAAAACGVEATLNALLLVGERAEALTVLRQTLERQPFVGHALDGRDLMRVLRRFPPRELRQERAKRLASRLYVEARLAQLRDELCVPLDDELLRELARRAAAELQRRQEGEGLTEEQRRERAAAEGRLEAETEALLIDWRRYDADDSGHLDLSETAALVEDLRNSPRKMIFRQFLGPEAQWTSHPTMRDRVLFLYDGFGTRD